ncbi:Calcineurin-like phosphoesterase [Chryseobacterium oleae]|uniref:Calcineurin-like phosphoesterase n=1 Tax=Chryseobacterium oleae TaxID=491207 RepID=A0A1I5A3W2_CHROL|nr:metallophosphoesterase [Chryseobacterium oleae]SFN57030.1 Calcineurin-like phosphoesterase [Chryseobacterium oleae]
MKIKKWIKWTVIVVASYFILSTLYFGYDDIDSKKGIYNFYWSGINGLWKKDKPFGFRINQPVETSFDGLDGPYIFGDRMFTIKKDNVFEEKGIDRTQEIAVETDCKELRMFKISLKNQYEIEKDQYKMPEKLIAISDIEGNFNAFYSFLLANKVIDSNGDWIFEDGHLVLNGDFVDRGNQVTQVLWLIYHLENQATQKGGKVHFILGNHEIMNLYGDVSYNDFKYIEAAKRISKQNSWETGLKFLYSQNSELGQWLRTKNVIEKIGPAIFVHGGLNYFHAEGRYSINEINSISRKYYGTGKHAANKRDQLILSSTDSPYWDRRLNFELKYKILFKLNGISMEKTTQDQLDNILNYYDAQKIIIGHSVVDDISPDYNNKVIKIDIKHGRELRTGKTKGLLIENNIYYKTDDLGNKTKLNL